MEQVFRFSGFFVVGKTQKPENLSLCCDRVNALRKTQKPENLMLQDRFSGFSLVCQKQNLFLWCCLVFRFFYMLYAKKLENLIYGFLGGNRFLGFLGVFLGKKPENLFARGVFLGWK